MQSDDSNSFSDEEFWKPNLIANKIMEPTQDIDSRAAALYHFFSEYFEERPTLDCISVPRFQITDTKQDFWIYHKILNIQNLVQDFNNHKAGDLKFSNLQIYDASHQPKQGLLIFAAVPLVAKWLLSSFEERYEGLETFCEKIKIFEIQEIQILLCYSGKKKHNPEGLFQVTTKMGIPCSIVGDVHYESPLLNRLLNTNVEAFWNAIKDGGKKVEMICEGLQEVSGSQKKIQRPGKNFQIKGFMNANKLSESLKRSSEVSDIIEGEEPPVRRNIRGGKFRRNMGQIEGGGEGN